MDTPLINKDKSSPGHRALANPDEIFFFELHPDRNTCNIHVIALPIDENESDASHWLIECRMTKTVQQRYTEEDLLFCNEHCRPSTASIFCTASRPVACSSCHAFKIYCRGVIADSWKFPGQTKMPPNRHIHGQLAVATLDNRGRQLASRVVWPRRGVPPNISPSSVGARISSWRKKRAVCRHR